MQSTGGQVVRLLSSLLDKKWERVLMSVVGWGVGVVVSGEGSDDILVSLVCIIGEFELVRIIY
jgi:hypothetical protein